MFFNGLTHGGNTWKWPLLRGQDTVHDIWILCFWHCAYNSAMHIVWSFIYEYISIQLSPCFPLFLCWSVLNINLYGCISITTSWAFSSFSLFLYFFRLATLFRSNKLVLECDHCAIGELLLGFKALSCFKKVSYVSRF